MSHVTAVVRGDAPLLLSRQALKKFAGDALICFDLTLTAEAQSVSVARSMLEWTRGRFICCSSLPQLLTTDGLP